jgi:hypothetical protein
VPAERRFVKIARKLLIAGMLVLGGVILGWRVHMWQQATSQPSVSKTDSGPTLEEIQTLADLTTLRVNVADAIVTELTGKTGSINVVLVVHGSVTLGVDLSKTRFESVDQRNRTALLVLPAPQVESISLDQQKTKVVALVENGLWIIVPGNGEADGVAANLAYREAEKVVERAAEDPELTERARMQAQDVLTTFFSTFLWTIQIRWVVGPWSPQRRDQGRTSPAQQQLRDACL